MSRWSRWAPWLLVVVVVLVYLPSLAGGYLNWDDPWLIQDNPILKDGSVGALGSIWTDLSRQTRLTLGAEFLPVRDTELWLEVRVLGLNPRLLRASALALYLAAVLLFRGALRRTLSNPVAAEVAAWVFALHPVHLESVAWLAGRKDVLALLFVGAALALYAGSSRHRLWGVPLLLALAHFSKSMTVTAVGLLLAQDWLARRKPDVRVLAAAAAVAVVAVLLHLEVGHVVHMTQPPAGGSRLSQLATMGPVWLRYAGVLLWPGSLSLVHDVPVRARFDAVAASGYLALAAWAVAAVVLWKKQNMRLPAVCLLWFIVPLVPVSQVVFPLQNQMTDRYLFLSVMAVALPLGALAARWPRPGGALAGLAVAGLSFATLDRSSLFADSVAAFSDATAKTKLATIAPYQLGQAYEDAHDDASAIRAYEEVLRRARGPEEAARRATNNLAKLLARRGDLPAAERVLRSGREQFPDDPKMLRNLVEVLRRQGRQREAQELVAESDVRGGLAPDRQKTCGTSAAAPFRCDFHPPEHGLFVCRSGDLHAALARPIRALTQIRRHPPNAAQRSRSRRRVLERDGDRMSLVPVPPTSSHGSRDRHDAIVIGSGVGGSVTAAVLAIAAFACWCWRRTPCWAGFWPAASATASSSTPAAIWCRGATAAH